MGQKYEILNKNFVRSKMMFFLHLLEQMEIWSKNNENNSNLSKVF
jgi:hypothetical protein